jgi:hypothetical protein
MGLFDFLKSHKIKIIGRDINWIDIIGKVFKIIKFEKAYSIDNSGNIIRKEALKPYGYLHVIAPDYEKAVLLPIVHKDDYLLASSVFDDIQWSEKIRNFDFLVTYVPKENLLDGFTGFTHALHYVITPAQTIEFFYKIEALRETPSNPEKLFVKFSYEGEIRVEFNPNPDL